MGLRVAVIGLGHFGQLFVPVFRDHPDVEEVIVFDSNEARCARSLERFALNRQFGSVDDILASEEVDAVFISTGLLTHAPLSVAALEAGKHCACAVTMGTRLDELQRIVEAQTGSGLNYMMFETAVFCREFMYVQELAANGSLGEIQLLRGSFIFDHSSLPAYWREVAPMHYATHSVGPLFAVLNTHAETVRCIGSGRLQSSRRSGYGHRHPIEVALFNLSGSSAVAEVTQSMFDLAREPIESFSVFGSAMSFEWGQIIGDLPVVHEISDEQPWPTAHRIEVPDYAERLPHDLQHHTTGAVAFDVDGVEHTAQGPHGGSHPHLVHEFVASIVEDRPAWPDAVVSAQWTAAGIAAHDSATNNGDEVSIPTFVTEASHQDPSSHPLASASVDSEESPA